MDEAAIVEDAAPGVAVALEDAAARHLGSVPRSLPPHPCPDSATEAAEVDLIAGKAEAAAAAAVVGLAQEAQEEVGSVAGAAGAADSGEAVVEPAGGAAEGPSGSSMRAHQLWWIHA